MQKLEIMLVQTMNKRTYFGKFFFNGGGVIDYSSTIIWQYNGLNGQEK